MKRLFSVFLCVLVLILSFSSLCFAAEVLTPFTPTVYGSVSPSSSVTSTVYGYVVNYTGKVPRSWILVNTAQNVYTLYYSLRNTDLIDCDYIVYHQSYNYSGAIFSSGSLSGAQVDVDSLSNNYTYVGNVKGTCAYAADYSASQFDFSFVLLCLIAVLFIVLLFRRGYPGRVNF